MAKVFIISPAIAALLASCIEIGLEGAEDNHADVGGENSQADLDAVQEIQSELRSWADSDLDVELTFEAYEDEQDDDRADQCEADAEMKASDYALRNQPINSHGGTIKKSWGGEGENFID